MSLARIGPVAARHAVVGDDALGGAVGVLDLELGQQRQPVAVDVAPAAAVAQPAAVPAVAQDGADGVAALLQQGGHVEGLVAQAVVVAGPAGRHDVVADHRAVDLGLVQAQRGDVQPRLRDAGPHVELAAQ